MQLIPCVLTMLSLILTITAVAQKSPAAQTAEEKLERRRQIFAPGRELLLRKGVPFDPDQLLEPGWKGTLGAKLDAMPEMHEVRYVSAPLNGLYLADTLYLPERVALAGPTVILVNHLLFEGKHVVVKGPHPMYQFTRVSSEVLGKPLNELLQDAGLAAVRGKATPPSYDELVRALGLDPYKHGKFRPVFEPGRITIDTSGAPGTPGIRGEPGKPGTPGKPGQRGKPGSPNLPQRRDPL